MRLDSFSISNSPFPAVSNNFTGRIGRLVEATFIDHNEHGYMKASVSLIIPEIGMISQANAEHIIRRDMFSALKKVLQPPNEDDLDF